MEEKINVFVKDFNKNIDLFLDEVKWVLGLVFKKSFYVNKVNELNDIGVKSCLDKVIYKCN